MTILRVFPCRRHYGLRSTVRHYYFLEEHQQGVESVVSSGEFTRDYSIRISVEQSNESNMYERAGLAQQNFSGCGLFFGKSMKKLAAHDTSSPRERKTKPSLNQRERPY
jgi:hypothetical protein